MTDSKLGLHINNWSGEILKFAECQPAVMKSIDHNPDMLKKFRRVSCDTLWIGRVYIDDQEFHNPKRDAQRITSLILGGLRGCRYDVLEGINEPDIGEDVERAKELSELNIYLARLLKAEGYQYAAYSFSATRPHLPLWPYLEPALKEADYLAMHAYSPGRLSQYDQRWYLFNYRLSWEALSEQIKKTLKGILLTELGCARGLLGGPDVGWKAGGDIANRHYGNDLIEADKQLDDYIIGATIFQTGDRSAKWHTFEVEELFPGLMKHIKNFYRTVKVPDSEKEEPKMKNPITIGIRQDYKVWDSPIVDIKTMEMEEYLRYCLPYEMYASWKPEALKAGAIAARTYATWMKKHGKHLGIALCNSACCQVMGPKTDTRTDRAIRETEGIIMTYQGEPIKAMYFSFCDGHTTNGGLPYLKAQPCGCRDIAPEDTPIAKHNNGLCQWGAQAMALQGATYREILRHYYAGVEIDGEKALPERANDLQEALNELGKARAILKTAHDVGTGHIQKAEELILSRKCNGK